MTPLVSIIIPCYNAEPWLAATVESALAQTWPAKEIILVNDGSRDGTLAVARQFVSRGVRVMDQPNGGACTARNHGLRLARGDFIQFLDADDLLSPDKIAAQVALLSTRSPGTVASCAWGRFGNDPAHARFVDAAVCRDFTAIEFLVLAGDTGAMMQPAAWLTPRAVADRAGPWAEQWLRNPNDDGEYFARVLLAGAGIAYSSQGRVYYRSGQTGSLSQQKHSEARQALFFSAESITTRLLAAEDSSRTRRACAGYWRRYVHTCYPAPADLIRRAESEIIRLGETTGRPEMGPKTRLLAALLGWRLTWRLKHWFAQT